MKISKIVAFIAVGAGALVYSFTGAVSAHVGVGPADVKTGAYQTFTVSVPTERDNPTVQVKLEIPMGLTSVTPTVKPGWTIQTEKHEEGKEIMITAITWTGGEIAPGYRDEFTFRAKTPSGPTDLQWKAYQTYKGGVVVSWDQQPSTQDSETGKAEEDATTGPFSVTRVLASSDQDTALKAANDKAGGAQQAAKKALYASIGGIVLALIGIIVAVAHKRSQRTPSLRI